MAEPTVTSKNVPQATPPVEKEVSYRDEDIIPVHMVEPDFVDLTPSSPHIALRWVNFKVGPGQSTLRYEQCKTMGFINAKPTDIKNLPPTYVAEGDKIINGDLILMKIDRARYLGILKSRRIRAEQLGGHVERKAHGISTVQAETSASGAPPELLKKVRPFIPSESDLSGVMGPDKQSPRR